MIRFWFEKVFDKINMYLDVFEEILKFEEIELNWTNEILKFVSWREVHEFVFFFFDQLKKSVRQKMMDS